MRLSPDEIAVLSRADARRYVQQKMIEVKALLDDCAAVMDHHRFTCDLPTEPSYHQLTYLPKNLTAAERLTIYAMQDGNLHWAGIQDHHEGGEWVSSSDFGDC